jgi:hypothetical protein
MPRISKSLACNLILCALSIVFSLEIGLRVLTTRSGTLHNILWLPSDYSRAESVSKLMKMAPVKVHVKRWAGMDLTEKGFRTPPYEQEKIAGTLRVLALGDSFTFSSGGVPHAQMWHTLVARTLEEVVQKPVESINLGKPSIGIGFSNRVLELEGKNLEPDIVLFGLFVGNDLHDEAKKRWWPIRMSYSLRLVKEQARMRESLRVISGEVQNGIEEMQHAITGNNYVYDSVKPTFSEEAFLRIENRKMYLFTKSKQGYTKALAEDALQILEQMNTTAHDAGALLVVVVMPEEMQIDVGLRKKVTDSQKIVSADYDFDWVQNTLVTLLREKGIEAVDLLPAMREAGEKEQLYRYRNTHWNIEGNRIAADQISTHLQSLFLEQKLSAKPSLE